MKNIFFLFLCLITEILYFSGCQYSMENSKTVIQSETEQPKYEQDILLFIVDTVFPNQQYITIISKDGEEYQFNYSGSEYSPNYWISFDENWYSKLTSLITEEYKTEYSIEENKLNLIQNQVKNFAYYSTKEELFCGNGGADMGTHKLYGVYSDEFGNPQCCFLADYGDNIICTNDCDAIEFINFLSDNHIFYTDYLKPYHYSIDEKNEF